MKITLFGASGKSGQLILDQALEKGCKVSAYVRRENAIERKDKNLEIFIGELDEKEKIAQALKGADVCISALGGTSLKESVTQVIQGIDSITSEMESQGIKRFLYLSSFGAGESKNYMAAIPRFLVVKILLKVPLADHNLNEERLQRSNLDWTVFRPGGLTDGPLSEKLKFGAEPTRVKGNPKISRASLAAFMLKQAADTTFNKKAIWLYE